MNGNEPLVSICCLSYNEENYIKEAIESFWNQDYKNIEIIALDDGSKDRSFEVLKELKEKSPCPMEVYYQENTGSLPINFNIVLKKARGKYIIVIALDDALLPDAISSKVDLMEQDERVQFVINTKGIDYFSDIEKKEEYTLNIDKHKDITPNDILKEDFYHIHSYYIQGTLYRKKLFDAIGGFDEDMISDDLVLRTKTARYLKEHPELSFGVLRTPAIIYRKHSRNISKNIALQLKSIAMFYAKYYPEKRRMRTMKNGFRTLLKQHHFKDAWSLYKQFPRYRDFTFLIPLWLLGIFLKDIFLFLKFSRKNN